MIPDGFSACCGLPALRPGALWTQVLGLEVPVLISANALSPWCRDIGTGSITAPPRPPRPPRQRGLRGRPPLPRLSLAELRLVGPRRLRTLALVGRAKTGAWYRRLRTTNTLCWTGFPA